MVDKWGPEIEAVLDSPYAIERLRECKGIGQKGAERIKAAWDMNKGELAVRSAARLGKGC